MLIMIVSPIAKFELPQREVNGELLSGCCLSGFKPGDKSLFYSPVPFSEEMAKNTPSSFCPLNSGKANNDLFS